MLNRGTWTVAHRRGRQSLHGLVLAVVLHLCGPALATAQEAPHAAAGAHTAAAEHATAAGRAAAARPAESGVTPAGPPIPVRLVAEPIGTSTIVQRFRLAPKVTEFMVVVYGPSLEGVQLRTPAGQLVTADNIWRVGRWQTGSRVSVISLDWSSAGEWMVLAPAPVPVSVVVDPLLVPVQTPASAEPGQPTLLRWQLQAGGRALDLMRLAEIVVVSARVIEETGSATPLAYALEANGVVSVTVPPRGPGIYNVETDIWLATSGQHVLHRLSVAPPVQLQITGRHAAPTVVVRVQDGGLKREATRAALLVTSSEGAAQTILGMRQIDGSFRIEVPTKAMGSAPGRAKLLLSIDGLTRTGQPWRTLPRLLARGASGSSAFATAVSRQQAGAAGQVAGGEHPPAARASNHATPGSDHAAQAAPSVDAGVAAFLLASPDADAPELWHYAGLGLANLVLVGLIWRRHKQRMSLRVQKPAATASARATPDSAGSDQQHTAETAGASPFGATSVPSSGIATSFHDAPAVPELGAIEPLELDALAELAELAEAQSDARSQRSSTQPDVDVAA